MEQILLSFDATCFRVIRVINKQIMVTGYIERVGAKAEECLLLVSRAEYLRVHEMLFDGLANMQIELDYDGHNLCYSEAWTEREKTVVQDVDGPKKLRTFDVKAFEAMMDNFGVGL
jgi:hypothetical protein